MIKIVYNPKNPVEVDLKTNRLTLNIVLGIILFCTAVLIACPNRTEKY